MKSDLQGRTALITGASSGIGEAAAFKLAELGVRVIAGARRAERLQQLAERIRARGGEAHALALDVTSNASLQAAADHIGRAASGLDILINNAGVMLLALATEASLDEWRAMIEVNLLGLMNMTRAILPFLKQSKGGHVVNVASLAGRIANANASGYAASKFGVVGFSESLRRELVADHIRVTVIEPGMVATELPDHISNEAERDAQRKRRGQTEALQAIDIAGAIVYAVSQPTRVSVNEIVIRPSEQEN